MAHSFVKVTESQQSDSLLLVVAEDGTVTPDRATVDSYLNNRSGATELQVMHVNKTDGQNIDVTLDTLMYVHSEEVVENEEIHPLTEDIFERDKLLRYISMDHDYFPIADNQQGVIDEVEIVDELAQTLSLLEGTTEEIKPVKTIKTTPTKPPKKITPPSTAKQKARMITTQQPPVPKQPKPTTPVVPKVIRQPPKPIIQIDEEESDEDYDLEFEDDDNDSDFELEEAIKVKPVKKPKPRPARRISESKTKVKKAAPKVEIEEKKVEEVEKEIIEVKPEVKSAEKKLVKKEKKVPKPPDDFALFSTPDIIRRVGGKEPTLPTTPTTPESPKKPAKILFETRSKSIDKKPATMEKPRTSIDLTEKNRPSIEKPKEIKKTPEKKPEGNVSVQGYDESLGSNSSESILEPQLEPMPSAEDIRAIIQNENTKSFTTSMVIPELVANDQNSLPLEAGGLDLDLDNINTDILSEDILYQVAKSLADNPELQNVIDKSIVDGNLMLDPGIQQAMSEDQNMPHTNHLQPTIMSPMPEAANRGTQIIRADGRVVVLPPIERPTTRSRNRKDDNQSQEATPVPRLLKPLDDEHVSGNELDSSGDEQIEEDDEDPNKLWCICNQPHNGRFMICCDKCTEWYHGKCVGVSKSQGQLMEKQKKEWVCRFCKNKGRERPAAAAQRVRKASRASRTSSDSAGSQRKSTSSLTSEPGAVQQQQPKAPACIVCGKTSRNSSIYCSDDCIRKHALGVDKVGVEKVGGYGERKAVRTLSGNGTPISANLDRWLQDHPEGIRPVNKSSAGPKKMTQSKLQLVKNSSDEGVSLAVNKKGMHVGVLHHMPKGQQDGTPKIVKKITAIKMLSKHGPMQKMTKLIQPVPIIKPQPSPTTPTTTTPVKTKPTPPAPKTPTPSPKEKPVVIKTPKSRQAEITSQQPKQENIRENVQKTLMEQLTNRLKMVNDLKLTEEEVTGISTEIENQLYKCFGETGQKYKNKYRSLIFNIKDVKNQTLWRRICEKSINPYQLVRLSPDDLASQELALWREREAKHQLDMIKKSELELLQCTRQYVFKTHKGEQVFEDDRPQDQTVSDVITGLNAEVTSEKEEVKKEPSKEKDRKTTSSASKHKRDRSRDRKSSKEKSDSKERRKDRRSGSRDKDRSRDKRRRSRSRDHSSRHSEKRRSRSRDRDRHRRSTHKSSRHKKEVTTEKLDKKSKEIWEQLVDKQIVPPLEDRLWKHVPQEDIVPAPNEESESDHEPTSTVTIPTPPRNSDSDDLPVNPPAPDTVDKPEQKDVVPRNVSVDSNEPLSPKDETLSASPASEAIWTGTINMVDVAQIAITAHEVSGDCHGLSEELPGSLDIVGRISPETVWDYIGKMKCSNSKMISLLKLKATNMEEKMPYIALYSYLSSRNRLGVVKSTNKAVKDFYILPLDGATPLPQALLPINGPGFEENRTALLIGIIVRDKRKRPILDSITNAVVSKKARVEVTSSPPPAVATSGSSTPPQPPSTTRSYTPPPNRDPRIKAPPVTVAPPAATPPAASTADEDEPYSPEDSDPEATTPPLPMSDSSRLSTNLMSNVTKNSSFLNTGLPTQAFKPFNNKFDDIPGLGLEVQSVLSNNSTELQRKMAELDQRIAMQEAEIHNMSQDIVSSASGSDIGTTALANIALPNNLQQILESIKIIGAARTDTDPPAGNSLNSSQSDLTIPLMLPKISSRALTGAAARADGLSPTIPLNLPKIKSKHSATNSPQRVPQDSDKQSQSSVLSSLSEEDLIRKAAEMLGESEATPPPTKKSRWVEPDKEIATPYAVPPPNLFSQPPPPINPPLPTSPNVKRSKIDYSQPPIPGLED